MPNNTTYTRQIDCPVCGRTYTATNFMHRWAVDKEANLKDTNVHEAKCMGWTVMSRRDVDLYFKGSPSGFHLSPEGKEVFRQEIAGFFRGPKTNQCQEKA